MGGGRWGEGDGGRETGGNKEKRNPHEENRQLRALQATLEAGEKPRLAALGPDLVVECLSFLKPSEAIATCAPLSKSAAAAVAMPNGALWSRSLSLSRETRVRLWAAKLLGGSGG